MKTLFLVFLIAGLSIHFMFREETEDPAGSPSLLTENTEALPETPPETDVIREPTPPEDTIESDVWFVAVRYRKGELPVAVRMVATEAEARAALSEVKEEYRFQIHSAEVLPDSPELKIRLNGFNPWSVEFFSARETWFERHRRTLAEFISSPRPANVPLWGPGSIDDPLATHRGGPVPLPEGAPWPTTSDGRRLDFWGVLDFRDAVRELDLDCPPMAVSFFTGVEADDTLTAAALPIPLGSKHSVQSSGAEELVPVHQAEIQEYVVSSHYGDWVEEHRLVEDRCLPTEDDAHWKFFRVFTTKLGGRPRWLQELPDHVPTERGERLVFLGAVTTSIQGPNYICQLWYSEKHGKIHTYIEWLQ